MLLRELTGGDPPHVCQLIFIDDPTGFGHRVMDGDRVAEYVLTRRAELDAAVAERLAAGYAETDRSLTRRVTSHTTCHRVFSAESRHVR